MSGHGKTRTDDLIAIGVAARMLGRSARTLIRWSQMKPPRLRAYRDDYTVTRYFRRGDVEALMPHPEGVTR